MVGDIEIKHGPLGLGRGSNNKEGRKISQEFEIAHAKKYSRWVPDSFFHQGFSLKGCIQRLILTSR